jgi:hypothetical protein
MAKPIWRIGLNAFGPWQLMAERPWSFPASGEVVKERGRIRAEHLAASAGAFQDSGDIGLPEIRVARVFPKSGWSDGA